ncbi:MULTISPECIES: flavin reductase family protein [unclassified Pseudomonas]|uniref:flavin reductase family protein n=1 Tax=unclassified Pseudomonas TaxID=196821 RepID=UPI0035BF8DD4
MKNNSVSSQVQSIDQHFGCVPVKMFPLVPEKNQSSSRELVSAFKQAMRAQASTVCILATQVNGVRSGMVATAVVAVSMDPPSLLISVNQQAGMYAPVMQSRRFSVNFLTAGHDDLVEVFSGGARGEARFNYGEWAERDEVPILKDACVSMTCVTEKDIVYGTHHLMIGRLLHVHHVDSSQALIWQGGRTYSQIS